jgi:hypothetical protein
MTSSLNQSDQKSLEAYSRNADNAMRAVSVAAVEWFNVSGLLSPDEHAAKVARAGGKSLTAAERQTIKKARENLELAIWDFETRKSELLRLIGGLYPAKPKPNRRTSRRSNR